MGTSVINPMIFYWMNVLGNLDCGLNIVGIGLTFVLAVRVFIYVMGMDELYYYAKFKDSSYHVREAEQSLENGTKYVNLSAKWLKANIIIIAVCLVITTFIPSRDTMLTMLVADMITYENIELTKDSAVALVDYIVEQVKAITG